MDYCYFFRVLWELCPSNLFFTGKNRTAAEISHVTLFEWSITISPKLVRTPSSATVERFVAVFFRMLSELCPSYLFFTGKMEHQKNTRKRHVLFLQVLITISRSCRFSVHHPQRYLYNRYHYFRRRPARERRTRLSKGLDLSYTLFFKEWCHVVTLDVLGK